LGGTLEAMDSQFATTNVEAESKPSIFRVFKQIWTEMTLGVGFWGALRPIVAALLALVPFLFLGQHFNKKHRKATDWTLLQIPLALTVILWFALWAFSIFDAWRDGTKLVSDNSLNN
tara:strand:- start:127 stop:477 length:351 start_codon:yes stop_codon:yes gene_type:complete